MPQTLPLAVSNMVVRASEDARSEVMPFWDSDSEGVPEEGMYQLASELDLPNTEELLAKLPLGYRLVYSIFNWEQSRAGEGFSAGIDNSGVALVAMAATSYRELGMSEESLALSQVLDHFAEFPEDAAGLQAIYDSVPNPFAQDWDRIPHAVRTLCTRAKSLFYAQPEA